MQPDYAYLSYGFWLQRTTDSMGAVTYDEVETFANAHGLPATVATDLAGVVGTASYAGSSVGVYVKNVLNQDADIVTATSGHFVADVNLNASFGGGDVPANNQFTISGTVDNFVLQHGEENDWAVSLDLADFGGRAAGNEPGETPPVAGSTEIMFLDGVATGDSTAPAGSWSGAFYGSSATADHDMDAATPDINPAPVAVVGEFNAHFTDGVAAGGYGVNINDE